MPLLNPKSLQSNYILDKLQETKLSKLHLLRTDIELNVTLLTYYIQYHANPTTKFLTSLNL